MKKAALGVLFTLLTLPLMAQKRLFTINDVIPGGSTYYQASMPETEYLTWWGDACIKLDMSHCQQVGTENTRPFSDIGEHQLRAGRQRKKDH